MAVTRRRFLQTAAALSASVPLHGFGAALKENTASPREPLRQFDYEQVQITGGPFGEQYKAIHAHYLGLSNDNLLKVYRQRAGLPAPGEDMGGWYDLNGFVPGHSLGQYISGMARIGASTGDPACHTKVHELVDGFAQTLGPRNESILRPDTNLWICYILDKHFAGMVDASTLSHVSSAKEIANRVLAGAQPLLPAKGRDRIGKKDPPYDETFIMPETLFAAGELTGNPAFQELAHRYLLDREFFDPLARGDDPFPGQHAYSHAIALSSGAAAYLRGGDVKYKRALEKAFTRLTTEQQFSSGGWGPNETFITPHKGELHAALSSTVDHFETPCGSYAATKLARYLTRMTAEPADTRYGDNLERVLYNTILAVQFPDEEGDYPYYSTYSTNAEKVYYQKKWPCCSGTLVQTVADYPLNLYFQTVDGLYVNQYMPSRLQFHHNGAAMEIVQETAFPSEDTVTLHLHTTQPRAFAMRLRIPSWTSGAAILVNGKPLSTRATSGTFVTIQRNWSDGDRVELRLPQQFRTEAIDELHPETIALMRGPVQYVALHPQAGLEKERLRLPAGLKQVGPQRFVETYEGRDVTFVPLYSVRTERYTTYFSKA